jgi:hypothetical protein
MDGIDNQKTVVLMEEVGKEGKVMQRCGGASGRLEGK